MKAKAGDSITSVQLETLRQRTFYGREKDNTIYPIALGCQRPSEFSHFGHVAESKVLRSSRDASAEGQRSTCASCGRFVRTLVAETRDQSGSIPSGHRHKLANLVLHGIDEPHIWHGNTLSDMAAGGDLFHGAPQFHDYVLMNPPFGGKEGKEAQTQFDYKTGATQVLFVQHVLKSLKPGGICGIVLDEGVLFRTNETAFVQTKRKLLEECDVWCVVSLPGGIFSFAGAGVKTNLMFFTKGRPTETIWYYDLSDLKIGKRTPLTRQHFAEFFDLLPKRRYSDQSWTVPFAANLQHALEEARPHRERAAELSAQATELEETLKEKKKAKSASQKTLEKLEEQWRTTLRESREFTAKAEAIENAVYDLKAVNPNKADTEDKRTPTELLRVIATKGHEADAALKRLQNLIASASK